jgi:DNA-binding beta-propeller fold protein YncE
MRFTLWFAREYGMHHSNVLHKVLVSRQFTIYQLTNTILYDLPKRIQLHKPKVIVIPTDIAIDPRSSFVYVLDFGRSLVHKFTTDGEFIEKFEAPAEVNDQKIIALDSTGNVYVDDGVGEHIVKLMNNGKVLDRIPIGSTAIVNDAAIDSKGIIYFNSSPDEITILSPDQR